MIGGTSGRLEKPSDSNARRRTRAGSWLATVVSKFSSTFLRTVSDISSNSPRYIKSPSAVAAEARTMRSSSCSIMRIKTGTSRVSSHSHRRRIAAARARGLVSSNTDRLRSSKLTRVSDSAILPGPLKLLPGGQG